MEAAADRDSIVMLSDDSPQMGNRSPQTLGGTTALIFLGEVPHPGTGKPEINLEQARLQIDLLDVLRIKTRGNLSPDEEGLLDRVLYELRMRWVARSSRSGG